MMGTTELACGHKEGVSSAISLWSEENNIQHFVK